jgi:hypothetical protein
VAAAVQRADHGLMVEAAEPGLAAFFADDIADEHPALQGVGGALAACEAFARRWRERTTRAHVMRMHLRHHMLTEVAPVPGALGAMRVATDATSTGCSMHRWRSSPKRACLIHRRRCGAACRCCTRRRATGSGTTAVAPRLPAGPTQGEGDARVGPVYTPPAMRRHGYATALWRRCRAS